ncbi:hypothetical protein LC586_20585 [Nostoc sp. CHAB 5714]|uniref:Uncharacterized protein n=1 Tax=Nostoc favosum CHAB5714 TaxID=2780399 RepID=A0ABS8IBW5_9NOSO|nr:hypothetical protein [Nostoc favosum CHAB5714]
MRKQYAFLLIEYEVLRKQYAFLLIEYEFKLNITMPAVVTERSRSAGVAIAIREN